LKNSNNNHILLSNKYSILNPYTTFLLIWSFSPRKKKQETLSAFTGYQKYNIILLTDNLIPNESLIDQHIADLQLCPKSNSVFNSKIIIRTYRSNILLSETGFSKYQRRNSIDSASWPAHDA